MDQEKINAYNLEQKRKVDEQSAKEVQKDNADGISKTVAASNGMVANIVAQSNKKTQDATKEVGTAVKDAGNSILEAMTSSQNQVAEALNNLVIATVVSKDPQLIQAAKDVTSLISSIAKAGEDFGKSNLNALPSSLDKLTVAIQEMISEDATDVEPDYTTVLDDIKKLLAKDVKEPVVNVSAPNVTVDTSAFEKAIKSLEKTIQANKVVIPKNDSSAVIDAVTSVKNAVEGQRFPVPNYVLPFKDINGAATQVQLDATGKLPISASLSGADGAIVDGVSSAIRATVLSLASAKPLTVGIVDGTGAQITSFGGGTQYADGAVRGTATGTIAMGDDGTNIQSIKVDAAGELQVDVLTLPAISGTVTADTELPAAAALADTTANPTVPGVGTYLMGWDGTGAVWDRLKQQGLNADAQTAHAKGVLETASNGYVFNGTTWDRAKGDATNGAFVNVKTSVLPTGAATSALQTQPGVDIGDVTINNAAGAAAVNIQDGGNSITVDGAVTTSGTVTEANSAAILTAVQIIDDTVATLGTTTYTEATTKANIIGAVRRDADTTLVDTTNEVAPLQVNAGGQLKTAVIASALPTGAATSALQTTQDTSINTLLKPANTLTGVTTVSTVTNVSQQSGVAISIGTGVRDAGTQRVTIATNDVVPITDNSGSLTVDAPVGTPAFVRLSDGAAAITTLPVSLASVPSHAVTNAGTFAVQTSATSTGGYTPGKLVSAATTNATVIKASAGTLGHISASNVNAAARYLKFYNKATTPTVGTDVPVLTYIIPGNTAGAGTNIPLPPQGINFSTGISFAITTEATDAGSTGVAVSEIVINYGFN